MLQATWALGAAMALGATAALADPAGPGTELDALSLADQAAPPPERPRDWHLVLEGAASHARLRAAGGVPADGQRMTLDFSYDGVLAPGWRAVLADRLDLDWRSRGSLDASVNTLKEAYLSWEATPSRIADLGRINVRHGVATGYNPTDFFRDGSLRAATSVDPDSLRRNRLGSVMLRGQSLWNGGGVTALYAPRLAGQPSDAPFSPDWGATNGRDRWLLAASRRLAEGISPQWLLYGEAHAPPQLGFNLSTALGDAAVGYVEWSGGRSRSLASRALDGPDDTAFRARTSAGLTYTLPSKLTLTAELEHNGAGMDEARWAALRRGPLPAYRRYRLFVNDRQDLPTRESLFLYGSWPDAGWPRLDLRALLRVNLADHSRMSWLEARYHWDRLDLALQWQRQAGGPGSEHGALPQRHIVQLLAAYFF